MVHHPYIGRSSNPDIAAGINFEQVKSDWQDMLILDAARIETNRMGELASP